MNSPNLVFQYRSVDVFQKIIETKKLRLTSATHQNDTNELNFVIEALKKYIETMINNNNPDEIELLRDTYNTFLENDLNYDGFITCFSEEKDLLSQWRGYADDGNGLAIGFLFDEIQKYNNLYFSKVEYVSSAKEITNICNDIFLTIYEKFITKNARIGKDYRYLMEQMQTASQIKQSGFKEEHEWRIVFILHRLSDLYNYKEERPYDINAIVERTCKADKTNYPSGEWVEDTTINNRERYPEIGNFNFYSTQTNLVPYFEFKFEPELVKEIVIGPNCKIKEHNLKCLLECNGFKTKGITITRSNLPYRSS